MFAKSVTVSSITPELRPIAPVVRPVAAKSPWTTPVISSMSSEKDISICTLLTASALTNTGAAPSVNVGLTVAALFVPSVTEVPAV